MHHQVICKIIIHHQIMIFYLDYQIVLADDKQPQLTPSIHPLSYCYLYDLISPFELHSRQTRRIIAPHHVASVRFQKLHWYIILHSSPISIGFNRAYMIICFNRLNDTFIHGFSFRKSSILSIELCFLVCDNYSFSVVFSVVSQIGSNDFRDACANMNKLYSIFHHETTHETLWSGTRLCKSY